MCASRVTRIAAIQLQCTENIEQNLSKITSLVKEAKNSGAKMAFLPEAFDFIARSSEESFEKSDFIQGKLISEFQTLARDSNIWLSLGGFHTKCCTNGRISDKLRLTHLVIDSGGKIVSSYTKLNLFDLKGKFKESDVADPGTRLTPPIDTPAGKLGLQICFDVRFPEFSTMLRKMGAEVIAYPSAFSYETGKAHWAELLKTRAVETQSYVVAAAQTGFHNPRRRSYGHTMILSPWGEVVAQCEEEVGFVVADIDRDLLSEIRGRLPCFETHRPQNFYPNSMCWIPRDIGDGFQFSFGGVSIGSGQIFLLSQFSVAFVNIRPALPGHVLVAPLRAGVFRYRDLSFDELVDLNFTVQRVGDVVEKHFQGKSLSVVVQDGPEAGQSIKHVHVHVIPRVGGDFADNDMLYVALQNEGKSGGRSEHEMAEEALHLRKYFY